jgi:uncharacterized ferritin-like protein (DUF455 family)
MNIYEFARNILESESLPEKLISIDQIDFNLTSQQPQWTLKPPAREKKIAFREERIKFPKPDSFIHKDKRALAFHFFANHELLAIEMMCAFILMFPVKEEQDFLLKRQMLQTISDEQKHFKAYASRMKVASVEFGDFPVSDFFWKYLEKIKTQEEFFALMSLTFEAANLDFALYYKDLFEKVGDMEGAKVLEMVYLDEINHVKAGVHVLTKKAPTEGLWTYYLSLLPEGLSAARSKGIVFNQASRIQAGLSSEFIEKVRDYKGDYAITKRKQWS